MDRVSQKFDGLIAMMNTELSKQPSKSAEQRANEIAKQRMEVARQKQEDKEYKALYGEVFCHVIGTSRLARLPIVLPQELGRVEFSKNSLPYLSPKTSWKGNPAIQGRMYIDTNYQAQPFIAIKTQQLEHATGNVHIRVECIYKERAYSIREDIEKVRGHNYRMAGALSCLEKGQDLPLTRIRDLLDGKTIQVQDGKYSLVMYRNPIEMLEALDAQFNRLVACVNAWSDQVIDNRDKLRIDRS